MGEKTITVAGAKIAKGAKMTIGKGWKLVHEAGKQRAFRGSLLGIVYVEGKRCAIFRVPE